MRGYRCDNCRDFQPEVIVPTDALNFFARSGPRLPESWVCLLADEGVALHFCSPACVAAYVETLMQQEVDTV